MRKLRLQYPDSSIHLNSFNSFEILDRQETPPNQDQPWFSAQVSLRELVTRVVGCFEYDSAETTSGSVRVPRCFDCLEEKQTLGYLWYLDRFTRLVRKVNISQEETSLFPSYFFLLCGLAALWIAWKIVHSQLDSTRHLFRSWTSTRSQNQLRNGTKTLRCGSMMLRGDVHHIKRWTYILHVLAVHALLTMFQFSKQQPSHHPGRRSPFFLPVLAHKNAPNNTTPLVPGWQSFCSHDGCTLGKCTCQE